MSSSNTFRFKICEDNKGGRMDKTLADLCDDLSRARIQSLIQAERVWLNGGICVDASRKLKEGDELEIEIPPPEPYEPEPEDIPLDIVYEDEDLLVINKQAGLVVHPGAGNPSGTLVNALLHHCGEELSGISGVLRPGIVHRLDKDTTGLMVVAKTDKAHQGLAGQLEDRSLSRIYQALVLGVPMPIRGAIDEPIGRHPQNRQKMAVNHRNGRSAKTHCKVIENYREALSLVECQLESGRTHQIRVHMAHIKHPIIGDPVYGPQDNAVESALKKAGFEAETIENILKLSRQALHARQISFIHPVTDEPLSFKSELSEDFSKILILLEK